MDWIPALLKHLGLSRSIVAAAFVTSLVLYLGPRLAPNYLDTLPREWVPVVVGALVFSGFLLVVWGVSALWGKLRRNYKASSALFASYQLDENEAGLLHALGENPREPLNLETVDYAAVRLSKLEVLEMVHALSRKGLVSVNPYSSKLVSLTDRGRERALEIQRIARRDGATQQVGRLGHVAARGRTAPLEIVHRAAPCRNVPVTFTTRASPSVKRMAFLD